MADKNCPNCGRETHPQASFCLGCGQTFDVKRDSGSVARREQARPYQPSERSSEPDYALPQRGEGQRLSIDERRRLARRRTTQKDVEDNLRPERPWWRVRIRRTEAMLAFASLPAVILLGVMAFVAIRGIADKLSKDEGADQVSFAASEDFDVGRVVSVGMTQDEIDEMTFDGVAGWRVVFLNDGSGEGTTVSAGELELTTDGANPVSSPYYMYLAFPASGTGAAPVALFLRSEGKIVFHVRGLGCDVAVAALAGTARRGPPPGSIC